MVIFKKNCILEQKRLEELVLEDKVNGPYFFYNHKWKLFQALTYISQNTNSNSNDNDNQCNDSYDERINDKNCQAVTKITGEANDMQEE